MSWILTFVITYLIFGVSVAIYTILTVAAIIVLIKLYVAFSNEPRYYGDTKWMKHL